MPFVLTIRPEPGCSASVAAGHAIGLPVEGCPLFEIGRREWEPPLAGAIDALLLGSANAIRQGGEALARFRSRPVYAVGDATASAAEAAGFTVAATGKGELQPLVDTLRPPLRVLRVTGAEHVPLVPPPGIAIETRVAYASAPLPLPGALAAKVESGAIVLLHSAAAARHFARECDRHRVQRGAVSLAALHPRIASAAGEGWREVRAAAAPCEPELLALALDMCHELPTGPNPTS